MKPKEQARRKHWVPLLVYKNRVNPKLEKELLGKIEQLEKEYLWISANEKSLKRTHLDKYIAVKNNKVMFESYDFEALLKVIIASKEDVDSFAVKRVTKNTPCLLL
jgi:hypothetical protein